VEYLNETDGKEIASIFAHEHPESEINYYLGYDKHQANMTSLMLNF